MELLLVCLILMLIIICIAGTVTYLISTERRIKAMMADVKKLTPAAEPDKRRIEEQYRAMMDYKVNSGLRVTRTDEEVS